MNPSMMLKLHSRLMWSFAVLMSFYLLQFKDRFTQQNMELLHEMIQFSPASLMTSNTVTPQDIENICKFYNFDANIVARELNDFRAVYQSMSELIDTTDLSQTSARARKGCKYNQESSISDPGLIQSEDDIDIEEDKDTDNLSEIQLLTEQKPQQIHNTWINRSFVKPMRALDELSSFTNLSCLMKILATIAVTSCSAERVMSRVKIIKKQTAQYNAG